MHTQTKLTPFLRAYVITALWSSVRERQMGEPDDINDTHNIDDIARDSRQRTPRR